jgi:hypothetical protein
MLPLVVQLLSWVLDPHSSTETGPSSNQGDSQYELVTVPLLILLRLELQVSVALNLPLLARRLPSSSTKRKQNKYSPMQILITS